MNRVRGYKMEFKFETSYRFLCAYYMFGITAVCTRIILYDVHLPGTPQVELLYIQTEEAVARKPTLARPSVRNSHYGIGEGR